MLQSHLIDKYFDFFCKKNLEAIESLLSEDVCLKDPSLGALYGKKAVLEVYKGIFSDFSIDLLWKKTYAKDENSYAVEFALDLIDKSQKYTHIEGVDCIEFKNDKIQWLTGYVLVNPLWFRDET